ncbi:MAG TPA: hypothetical protein VEK08_18950, partial [Planctomycetota bacterium]|nr:hypothetical protein [Planctomycetota bacterium]
PTVLKNSQEEYNLWAALKVLNSWKMPEDTELISKFLSHPCEGQVWKGRSDDRYDLVRTFSVRQKAKQILEERGATVPENVVLEEFVKTTDKFELR